LVQNSQAKRVFMPPIGFRRGKHQIARNENVKNF
jgi:hypothetical protein